MGDESAHFRGVFKKSELHTASPRNKNTRDIVRHRILRFLTTKKKERSEKTSARAV